MATFILNRLTQTVLVVLTAALVSFALFRYVGDPVNNMVGQAATLADREAMRRALGLEDPVVFQFLRYLKTALTGDLGISYRFGVPVTGLLLERLPATLELSVLAMLVATSLGIPLGVWTALHRRSITSQFVLVASLIGVALPTFLIGIVLILIFSVAARLATILRARRHRCHWQIGRRASLTRAA
jgi:peptide/nickel transport system permease protein